MPDHHHFHNQCTYNLLHCSHPLCLSQCATFIFKIPCPLRQLSEVPYLPQYRTLAQTWPHRPLPGEHHNNLDLFFQSVYLLGAPDGRCSWPGASLIATHCNGTTWDAWIMRVDSAAPFIGLTSVSSRLPPLPEPPEPLRTYLSSDTAVAREFRKDIWKYNRAFAFTSIGAQEDHSINRRGAGPPVYRISGELYHASAALTPPAGRLPRYAQLYVIQPQAALAARLDQNQQLNPVTMWALQNMLMIHHPFTQTYRHAYQILQEHQDNIDYQVTLRLTPGTNRGVYNLPTVNEVAFILPGTVITEARDIVLRLHGGLLKRISDLNPAYATLQYPLIFPHGTYEWHPQLRLIETEAQRERRLANRRQNFEAREEAGLENDGVIDIDRKLTLSTFTAYRSHFRRNEFNTILRKKPDPFSHRALEPSPRRKYERSREYGRWRNWSTSFSAIFVYWRTGTPHVPSVQQSPRGASLTVSPQQLLQLTADRQLQSSQGAGAPPANSSGGPTTRKRGLAGHDSIEGRGNKQQKVAVKG
ncbi:hypothetical protein MD484_g1693, partial [Candolleomyces efflorescens]